MKANELMIGDWVLDGNVYAQVSSITCDGIIETTHNEHSNIELVEPIPITPEILEKNGWVKDGYFYKAEDGSYIQLGELFEHASFRAEKHGIPREIQTSPHLLEYVHQLQHALRLCGISKEIEL